MTVTQSREEFRFRFHVWEEWSGWLSRDEMEAAFWAYGERGIHVQSRRVDTDSSGERWLAR